MKYLSRARGWVVAGCLLLAIFSTPAMLSVAQGDQDQSNATLNLNATYTAEAKHQTKEDSCDDHILATYVGSARFKLISDDRSPSDLASSLAGGREAERTGNFSITVQGGGKCVGKDRGPFTWTYRSEYTAVPPDQFPSIGVDLQAGDYRIQWEYPSEAITSQSNLPGGEGIPLAFGLFVMLKGHSLLKVNDALHGTFKPYSKQFSASNGVTDSCDVPPNNDGNSGHASMNLSYHLNVGAAEEVEAIIITPKNYDQWLPRAGHDEDTPGDGLAFKVVLQKKGEEGKAPAKKAKSFKFELADVSREPGVCLNSPPKSQAKTSPDLKIDPEANSGLQVAGDGQSATASGDGLLGSGVTVFSYDWGAYGKLKVTATLDDNSTVVAHLKGHPDIEAVTIPRDDNGNHIADDWEHHMGLSGGPAVTLDDDNQPQGDGDNGDGLSLYEEYRGFMTKGEHHRTDPRVKDVFINNDDKLPVSGFYASGLNLHILDASEYDTSGSGPNPRVVNFNTSGFGHLGDEHVIEIVDQEVDGGLGVTIGGPGVPKQISLVLVDKYNCLHSGYGKLELVNTVGHELAHACKVKHHGDKNYDAGEVWQQASDGSWTPKGIPGWTVAAPHGQNSGDEFCIMRYYRAQLYEYAKGNFRWNGENQNGPWILGNSYYPTDAPGTTFCTSPTGTGVNASSRKPAPKAGDADTSLQRGNCAGQFCVNDMKH